MAANALDAAIVGNTVADALALGTQSDSANFLAQEALSLFSIATTSTDGEFKDQALMDLVNRDLLPGLTWAEAQTLDRNGDQIIQKGEADELITTGDLFQQLAAEFMSKATRDVTLEELQAVAEQAAGAQESPAGEQPVNVENPDYAQFSGESTDETPTLNSDVRPAFAPEGEQSSKEDESSDLGVLQSKDSSIKDRLKAIKSLVQDGKTTATIKDSDANELSVRMEVVPVAGSAREMVHMFAVDPSNGSEYVVLRAISDGDSFAHQRDEHGQEVDFAGTKWQRNHPNSMFSKN